MKKLALRNCGTHIMRKADFGTIRVDDGHVRRCLPVLLRQQIAAIVDNNKLMPPRRDVLFQRAFDGTRQGRPIDCWDNRRAENTYFFGPPMLIASLHREAVDMG